MTYMYLRTDLVQPIDSIFKPFEASFMTRGAPEGMALFHARGDDAQAYLIPSSTVAAAPEVEGLGEWVELANAPPLRWGLLIGHADAWTTHNVPQP